MKKFFSMFSIVMAIASVSFVSCNNDDDVLKTIDPQSTRTSAENDYLALKFWASDDLLDIAEVTYSGFLANYSYSDALSITSPSGIVLKGNAGALIEAPKETEGKITFTLKDDWKQRIEGKEHINLASVMAQVKQKGGETNFASSNFRGLIVDKEKATEDHLKKVLERCNVSITK